MIQIKHTPTLTAYKATSSPRSTSTMARTPALDYRRLFLTKKAGNDHVYKPFEMTFKSTSSLKAADLDAAAASTKVASVLSR